MKAKLKPGDEVYFEELDRIGREKALIKEELEWFKAQGVIVRVMDVRTTLMEFPDGQNWVLEMANNILIEVLGTIAEQEWKKIKKRREEGIAAMPVVDGCKVSSKTGRGFGRKGRHDGAYFGTGAPFLSAGGQTGAFGGGAGHRHRLDRGLLAAHLLLPPHQAEGICRNLLTFQQVSAKMQLSNLQQVRKEDPL